MGALAFETAGFNFVRLAIASTGVLRKTKTLAVAGVLAITACFLGVNELMVLVGVGFALIPMKAWGSKAGNVPLFPLFASAPGVAAVATTSAMVAAPFNLSLMFFFFLKVGAVLFGSGYVLLAFLRADLVERWGWLTESQLLDAIAVGQFTPGPVFTTATFIGFILSGPMGALLATVGIFLPAFGFVALSAPLIPKLRASPAAGAFLDGVNVASLALMAVVTWQLGGTALVDWLSILLAIVATVLLLRWRINSAWLVLGGGVIGVIKHLLA